MAQRSSSGFGRARGDSFDIMEVAFFDAARESARFWLDRMPKALAFENDMALLGHGVGLAPAEGMILEFGVATGRTIRHLGRLTRRAIDGFDSFEGLPEDWRTGFARGKFRQALPKVPAHVSLHKGWFSDTLPAFLAWRKEKAALVHIDCDLYSSTAFVLEALRERIGPGTVLVFDEYLNYPGWQDHEHKAFEEFIAATGRKFRYDSFVPSHQQLCVVITG
jgi:hypothetical protein